MLNRLWLIHLSVLMVIASTGFATAAPITWYFSGELTRVSDYGGVPDDVVVGMPFSGSFTYEPPIPDSIPDIETKSTYNVGSNALTVNMGRHIIISGDTNGLSVTNNGSLFAITLYALDFDNSFGYAFDWSFSFVLIGEPLWPGTRLPTSVPLIEDFEFSTMAAEGDQFGLNGMVNQLTPEPGNITFFMIGGCIFIFWRWST